MTVQELIQGYRKHNPDGHYFDKSTLRFFGERVEEMEIMETVIRDRHGKWRKVWCLKSIQHNAPPGQTVHYAYFDRRDFSEVE